MLLDLSTLSPNRVYHTMTQVVIPRPIAWVLSDNGNSSFNLAPFSYFSAVSSDPPLIMLSIGKKPDGEIKDTRRNILERKQFVVHITPRTLLAELNASAATLPTNVSELDASGLATGMIEGFTVPRLRDCRIALACSLYKSEAITASQVLIFGEVKKIWIDDAIVQTDDKGRIQISAAGVDPLARLGGEEYATFGEVTSVPRPR